MAIVNDKLVTTRYVDDITIEPCTESNIEAFVAFRKKSRLENNWLTKVDEFDAKKYLSEWTHSNGKGFFLAFRNGSIVGQLFFLLRPKDSVLEIRLISVLESERGKGTAWKLLDFAEMKALENNLTTVELFVEKSNTRAIAFYVKNGYNKTSGRLLSKTARYRKTVR